MAGNGGGKWFSMAGNHGQVHVGHQWAATLGRWEFTWVAADMPLGARSTSGDSTIARLDRFWITQRPVAVSLWMGSRWWVWRHADLLLGEIKDGGRVTVTLVGDPTVQVRPGGIYVR